MASKRTRDRRLHQRANHLHPGPVRVHRRFANERDLSVLVISQLRRRSQASLTKPGRILFTSRCGLATVLCSSAPPTRLPTCLSHNAWTVPTLEPIQGRALDIVKPSTSRSLTIACLPVLQSQPAGMPYTVSHGGSLSPAPRFSPSASAVGGGSPPAPFARLRKSALRQAASLRETYPNVLTWPKQIASSAGLPVFSIQPLPGSKPRSRNKSNSPPTPPTNSARRSPSSSLKRRRPSHVSAALLNTVNLSQSVWTPPNT